MHGMRGARALSPGALVLLALFVGGCEMLPRPTSPEAQQACREVAGGFEPRQLARVVAAFDTTVAGVEQYQRRVGSTAGRIFPEQHAADSAFLCYLDGSFGPGPNGQTSRVVVAYVLDPTGGSGWGVIHEGTQGDVFVVAP